MAQVTTEDVLTKVVEAVGRVREAQATMVEMVRKVAEHENSPSAHGITRKESLSYYTIGNTYTFLNPDIEAGFVPAYGTLITDVSTRYPEATAFFKTTRGQKQLVTETEWQALVNGIWHTNADGTQVGWGGIGGACKFVFDEDADTLRVPDLRGCFAEVPGGPDSPGVGEVKGDGSRPLTGAFWMMPLTSTTGIGTVMFTDANGVFQPPTDSWTGHAVATNGFVTSGGVQGARFDSSRMSPVSSVNRPKSYGVLTCVYLGTPH